MRLGASGTGSLGISRTAQSRLPEQGGLGGAARAARVVETYHTERFH